MGGPAFGRLPMSPAVQLFKDEPADRGQRRAQLVADHGHDPTEINGCRSGCKARGKVFLACTAFEIKIPCTPFAFRFVKCDCKANLCAPCPPGGPFPNTRIDRVPPSSPHFPCPGDHWHYRVYNQNPTTCQCFPSKWMVRRVLVVGITLL
jgi:hypothetical protein